MGNVDIHITVFKNGEAGAKVHPDPATIDKDDEAVWICNDPFDVEFVKKGEPFKDDKFDKSKNKSGKPEQSVTGQNKKFKYTVKVGDTTIDPHVIIP